MNEYHTLMARIAAFIIDSFIYFPLYFLIYFLLQANLPTTILGFCILLIMLAPTFYRILMHVLYGQTFGKMAVKVKIVTDDEQPITINHAVLRSLPQIFFTVSYIMLSQQVDDREIIYEKLSVALTIFYLFWIFLDNIVAFIGVRRKSLHDWLAGTIVVKTR